MATYKFTNEDGYLIVGGAMVSEEYRARGRERFGRYPFPDADLTILLNAIFEVANDFDHVSPREVVERAVLIAWGTENTEEDLRDKLLRAISLGSGVPIKALP